MKIYIKPATASDQKNAADVNLEKSYGVLPSPQMKIMQRIHTPTKGNPAKHMQ